MNRNSASFPSRRNLAKHQAVRFSSLGFRSLGGAKFLPVMVPAMVSVMVIAVLGVSLASSISWQSHARGNYFQQKIFTNKSIRKKTSIGARVIRASVGRYVSPDRLDNSFRSPGAKVINVARALEARKSAGRHKKGFKITIRSNSPAISGPAAEHSRLLSRDGYGLAVPDFGDMNCQVDYDCTIRMGNSPSSPKIIVVGQKRAVPSSDSGVNPGPKIIHPPS